MRRATLRQKLDCESTVDERARGRVVVLSNLARLPDPIGSGSQGQVTDSDHGAVCGFFTPCASTHMALIGIEPASLPEGVIVSRVYRLRPR